MIWISFVLLVAFSGVFCVPSELSQYCQCSENSNCVCNLAALSSHVQSERAEWKAAWEREKDEWRQELQADREQMEASMQETCDGPHASKTVAVASTIEANEKGKGISEEVKKNSNDPAIALKMRHAAELRKELETLQFSSEKSSCGSIAQLHFLYRQMGLGAELHGITLALTYGYITHRMVTFDPQPFSWVWADPDQCAQESLSCWLEPMTSCSANLNGHPLPARFEMKEKEYYALNEEFDFHSSLQGRFQSSQSVYMHRNVWNRGNDFIPSKYRSHGLFWWRSQLLSFVLRPNAKTLAHIEKTKKDLK